MKKYLHIGLLAMVLAACNGSAKKEDSMAGMDMTMGQMNPDAIMLTEQQMLLSNIQVDTVRSGVISDRTILTATLNIDQTKINTIPSRVMGRIEKLYFKNPGDYIHRGDRVMDIYSEELNNDKQEYLLALEKKDKISSPLIDIEQIVESAKNKLLLWGLSESQIKELERTKSRSVETGFYSSYSGYITSLETREGEYIPEGGTVLRLAELSTLWAEAQVYSSQMSVINDVKTATVQFPDVPNLEIKGTVQFVNPELSEQTRINLMRVTISNRDNRLKPGMPAYVFIKSKETTSLVLPSDAVIRNADNAVVWVQTGKRMFERRMVEIGRQEEGHVQILSGIKEGDLVVTSGAYLINSESIFKKGGNAMEGMKM